MQKAIHIENSNKNIARVLSIAEPEIIENNPQVPMNKKIQHISFLIVYISISVVYVVITDT